jgi:K+-sensing histidine kinase KdpD
MRSLAIHQWVLAYEKAQRIFTRYAFAVFAVGLALLLRSILAPLFEQSAEFFLFTLAIVLAAWRGGLGPGLFTSVLSVLVVDYFFVEPRLQLTLLSRRGIGLVLFLLSGIFISWFSEPSPPHRKGSRGRAPDRAATPLRR